MREITTPEGIVENYFDSLSEWEQSTTQRDFGQNWNSEWNGGYTSYESAFKDASSSNKYSEQIKALTSKITSMIQASIPDYQPQFDVTGLGFDVGLALSGVPECWVTMAASKEPKVVKILFNCAVSAGIDTSHIIAKGVGVCALICSLEMAGVSTEVTLCFDSRPHSSIRHREGIRTFIKYKEAGEYFDIEKFAWGVCSPAFFRILAFNWIRTKTGCGPNDSLPWPTPRMEGKDADIYFGHMYLYDEEFKTEETTIKWVVEKCKEYGVEVIYPILK